MTSLRHPPRQVPELYILCIQRPKLMVSVYYARNKSIVFLQHGRLTLAVSIQLDPLEGLRRNYTAQDRLESDNVGRFQTQRELSSKGFMQGKTAW